MIKTFRRHMILLGSWHFHPECSRWPKADYIEDAIPADPEDLCLECIQRCNDKPAA